MTDFHGGQEARNAAEGWAQQVRNAEADNRARKNAYISKRAVSPSEVYPEIGIANGSAQHIRDPP